MHEDGKTIQQDEINHAVSVVVSKHNNKIMIIQEEVKILEASLGPCKKSWIHLKKINRKSNTMG